MNDPVIISREEFNSWKDNKVTQSVFQVLTQAVEQDKEYLANGGTLSKDGYPTEYVVGRIQGLGVFLNIDYEEAEEAVSDDN